MNVILAVIWFFLGVSLLVITWVGPENVGLQRRGMDFELVGWVAMALCIYNLMRWWAMRANKAQRSAQASDFFERYRGRRTGGKAADSNKDLSPGPGEGVP